MSSPEIVQVLRGRSFRDTLFGKVRYGQAIMKADGVQREVPVVIKEYDRELVERRMTKNGEHVGEDAKEELRIHSLLSQALTTAPASSSSASSTSPAPSSSFGPCGHPHVVHLFDVRKDDRFYYAILEFCARGEFFPLVQLPDFSALYARHYFRQLVQGLAFMHRQNIAHRDLSLENILLDDKGNLKICDFGVAVQCADVNALMVDTTVPVGKVKFYMPPEVFARQPYSPAKVDVWTAGIILFVMLTKVHPFKYATAADARFMMVYSGKMNELLRRWGKEALQPHAEDLLKRMLCPMEQRMTVEEVLAHPYVREDQTAAPQPSVGPSAQGQPPPMQHQQSHYEPSASPLSGSKQVLSPNSPSYNLPPVLPVYAAAPSVAVSSTSSTSPPSRPTYVSASSSQGLPHAPSAAPHLPQRPPLQQPHYNAPVAQTGPQAHQAHSPPFSHPLIHHRPQPVIPTLPQASSQQPLPQHYAKPVPAPSAHYSSAPDMMQ